MSRIIREMTHDQVVTEFLVERGCDPTDEKLRQAYSADLIGRFQKGDVAALAEILQLGPRHGGIVQM